ncbi:MAG: hypothetical protein GEV08_23320 [Acidimicrobiia bacterium]|nr:hypothetical protein [Acidimicrobiia bacterium]
MFVSSQPPSSPGDLARLEALIEAFFVRQLEENEVVKALDHGEAGQRRWYLRLAGEAKATFTIWFTLGQRTLSYETYVIPAPEENHQVFYEQLLRRNLKLYGAHFAIGAEDAVFLVGQLANDDIDEVELDRVVGSIYVYVEQFFVPAMRVGFASRFS